MKLARKPGVGYPQNVVTYARRLHEENGWGAHQIRKSLQTMGYDPAHTTVLAWIDPDYAAGRRERCKLERRRRRGTYGKWKRLNPSELRLSRMRELRDAGVSYAAIAKVVLLDFELALTGGQVERVLKGEIKNLRRLLYPEGAKS